LPSLYAVIDFETTGFSPNKDDIIEFAAVKVTDGEIGEVITELCAPKQTYISSRITQITGITPGMVADELPFELRLREFLDFIGNDTVVAHNIPFDMGFLRRYCGGAGLRVPSKTLCTLQLSRRICRLKSHKLEEVAKALGVEGSGYHRALSDAVTTARVLMELLPMT
jgi:DNA polymerase III epsilon subunit family exonuclease